MRLWKKIEDQTASVAKSSGRPQDLKSGGGGFKSCFQRLAGDASR